MILIILKTDFCWLMTGAVLKNYLPGKNQLIRMILPLTGMTETVKQIMILQSHSN